MGHASLIESFVQPDSMGVRHPGISSAMYTENRRKAIRTNIAKRGNVLSDFIAIDLIT
jgi:hypothetical protein